MNPTLRRSGASKASSEDKHAGALAALVDRLPVKGSILVIHSHGELPATRRLVQVRRGPVVASGTRIVVAPTEADERAAIGSATARIVHSPFLAEQRAHAAALARVWSAA